ncbi:ABC transporter permease [Microbacterium sp. CH12i]|uniref:ABC transporter permease n=1 Tax=Microbacterium sp. CH12i TaxID=1479651 RepID=UPI000AB8884B
MSAVASLPTIPDTVATGPRFTWLRERGMGASVLVAALSSALGVVLVEATSYIGAMLKSDPYIGDSGTLGVVVALLSVLLIGVALYVGAIVTANTFSTIIAGRTRHIALVRLIGGSARSQRIEVARQGLVVGAIGAIIGVVFGLLIVVGGLAVADRLLGSVPSFTMMQPTILVPALGVALTTWAAAWIGSRRVLAVTPLQAIAGSVERSHEDAATRPARHVGALLLLISGLALLVFGIFVGLVTPLGVVVAFFGGLLSFTGLSLAAVLVMPPMLRLVGRLFGRSATARLAAENALRYPERSSRMAIGVVNGSDARDHVRRRAGVGEVTADEGRGWRA